MTETDSGTSPICFCHAGEVLGRALHGEQAELDDQAAAFGDRDEVGRRDHAAARMIPAQQRLEAGDAAVLQPHDRLVGEREFLALDGAAQVGFELQPVGADGAEGRAERLDAVAAEALGLVHGKLGVLDHVLGRGSAAVVQVMRPIEAVSTISRLAKVIGALIACLMASATAAMRGRVLLGQQHQRELVAGEARQRVLAA